MEIFLEEAKSASRVLSSISGRKKNQILCEMADALRENVDTLLEENLKDMEAGKKNNLSSALMDRLFLDASRVDAMAVAIEEIASLKEPVGRILDGWVTEDGLNIQNLDIEQVGSITCSFGVCCEVIKDETDFDELVEKVDNALYSSKANGKNMVSSCN